MVPTQKIAKPSEPFLALTEQERIKSAFGQIPYSPKFQKSLEFTTLIRLNELRMAHPDWGLPQVLAALAEEFPPETPPSLVLRLVKRIIKEWLD